MDLLTSVPSFTAPLLNASRDSGICTDSAGDLQSGAPSQRQSCTDLLGDSHSIISLQRMNLVAFATACAGSDGDRHTQRLEAPPQSGMPATKPQEQQPVSTPLKQQPSVQSQQVGSAPALQRHTASPADLRRYSAPLGLSDRAGSPEAEGGTSGSAKKGKMKAFR